MIVPTIYPGEQLAEELGVLKMSAAELARKMHVPANRVTQILNGRRAITATPLSGWRTSLAPSRSFWVNLQSLYDFERA